MKWALAAIWNWLMDHLRRRGSSALVLGALIAVFLLAAGVVLAQVGGGGVSPPLNCSGDLSTGCNSVSGLHNPAGSVVAATVDANGNILQKQALADQSTSVQSPTTGFTITIGNNISTLMLTPSATLASGTINLPAAPVDKQIVHVSSSQTITALTVSGNGNTISNAPTALTISATGSYGFAYIYNLASTTWLRLQ